ncbi:MAG: hypothetical protein K5945_04755 [Bacteroidaceae bacterium]|nr:hypothetical protein [Bacteroidaceae bacterium]
MKKYIKPSMETGNVSECEMLAASLPIGEGTVNGADALGKENKWDIFGEDTETEE